MKTATQGSLYHVIAGYTISFIIYYNYQSVIRTGRGTLPFKVKREQHSTIDFCVLAELGQDNLSYIKVSNQVNSTNFY